MFWMMPSRRERTLMRMRNRARALGILVELIEIDDPAASAEERVSASGRVRTPKLSGVAYRLPFLRALTLAPAWAIVRVGRAHAVSQPPGLPDWQWTKEPDARDLGNERYWQDVARVLGDVSEDVFSCEANPHAASFLWRERVVGVDPEAAVERLVERLREFADLQRMRHVARETQFERQDLDDHSSPQP